MADSFTERMILEATPCNEDCAQLGDESYELKAVAECRAFIGALRRAFVSTMSREPKVRFRTLGQSHDFGTYYGVAIEYDPNDISDALWFDSHAPTNWDAEALAELGL